MRARAIATAAATALTAAALAGAAPAQAAELPLLTTCAWGGTPLAPTGTFEMPDGVTFVPSTEPGRFRAVGQLSGGASCKGRFTFEGVMKEGSTCGLLIGEGPAKGLPGVARWSGSLGGAGVGPAPLVTLYDAAGKVVGLEYADIVTPNLAELAQCGSPEGFTGGKFSSVIVLF